MGVLRESKRTDGIVRKSGFSNLVLQDCIIINADKAKNNILIVVKALN
jgi:hypothetical protein